MSIEGGQGRANRRRRWPTPGRVRAPDPRPAPEVREVRVKLAAHITENGFMGNVLAVADLAGWKLRYHTHDSRRSTAGFPDLVLIHERRGLVIFAELKTQKGRVSPEQKRWITALRATGQAAYIWRPSDWDELCVILGVHPSL